jgi:NADPH:quinone reductase-like Zn-dependent oxidoreductase
MRFTENSRKLSLPFGKKNTNAQRGNGGKQGANKVNHQQTYLDVQMGGDDVEYFKRELSSDSRDEDEGFFEYESLAFFNLPRAEGPIDIVITVQAATISSRSVPNSAHVSIDNEALDLTSGHAIVGIVKEIGPEVKELAVGDRVATIIKSLTPNPRYAKVSSTIAVKVPCGVDSAEAAVCAYTFLRSFQSINHGVPFSNRYSNKSLKGQSILIIDGVGITGVATMQLALNAGAKDVYAIGLPLHHKFIKSYGATPLDPDNWIETVENKMDLVIDSVQANHYKQFMAGRALKPNGKIVVVGKPITIEGLKTSSISCQAFIEDVFAQLNLLFVEQKKATFYDLFSSLYYYPELMKVSKCQQSFILSVFLEISLMPTTFSVIFTFMSRLT